MLDKKQVIKLLKDLLLLEYLQRDVYETYSYWLFGYSSSPIQEHLKEHMLEEMKHIETLQRYLMYLGSDPILDRFEIPQIPNPTFKNILLFDLDLEEDAVKRYTEAIQYLDKDPKYSSLRIDIENILVQEQEHVHDLDQWLRSPDLD